MKTAYIIGCTGLVGKTLLEDLLKDSGFSRVVSFSRRPPDFSHEKLEARILDLENLDQQAEAGSCDVAFCCLGTTMKQAGGREGFIKVDHDYVLAFARLAKKAGARHFILVSSLGASAESRFFYSRVKGRVENDLREMGFHNLSIFRPSLLIGERREFRPGERAAILMYRIFGKGPARPWLGTDVTGLSGAMLRAGRESSETGGDTRVRIFGPRHLAYYKG